MCVTVCMDQTVCVSVCEYDLNSLCGGYRPKIHVHIEREKVCVWTKQFLCVGVTVCMDTHTQTVWSTHTHTHSLALFILDNS